jgi:hypothetical protein
MNSTDITSTVTLILALSVASERLVEIIKGFFPSLDKKSEIAEEETKRRAKLQFLAVLSGLVTAWLASYFLPQDIVKPTEVVKILGLGLLASGGSGFWNSILDYVTGLKDLTNAQAKKQTSDTAAAGGAAPAVLPNAPA